MYPVSRETFDTEDVYQIFSYKNPKKQVLLQLFHSYLDFGGISPLHSE